MCGKCDKEIELKETIVYSVNWNLVLMITIIFGVIYYAIQGVM